MDSIPKFSENVGIESTARGVRYPLGTVPHPPSPGTSLAVDSIPKFLGNVGIESTAREVILCYLEWVQKVGFGNGPGHNLVKVSAIWAQNPNFHISFSRSFLVWAQKNIVDGQNSISRIEKMETAKMEGPKT